MPPFIRTLSYLNLFFVCATSSIAGVLFFIFPTKEISSSSFPLPQKSKKLPKSPFAQLHESRGAIFEGALHLEWTPPTMQLPDLRNELIFFGKNERPDISCGKKIFHIGLKETGEVCSFEEGAPIYLVYRRDEELSPRYHGGESASVKKGSYSFSAYNKPTALWAEIRGINGQSIEVKVNMVDEKGASLSSPSNLKSFSLPLQNFPKSEVTGWQLGNYRVDSTLLIRLKAEWIGPDRFLQRHGGEEYAYAVDREKIDFRDKENPYCCFIREGDFLVWKEDRWEMAINGEETANLPLMTVGKVDEKVISLEIWHPEGKGKYPLNLIRSKDRDGMPNLTEEFKFIGAKTWAQFIVEDKEGKRMTLRANDWLLLTDEGWKKLGSAEEIDAYVERRLVGPLFILDKLTKQNGQQILEGHLFNTSRTEVEEVTLTASNTLSLANFYRNHQTPLSSLKIDGGEE